jgi:hypothetical protein
MQSRKISCRHEPVGVHIGTGATHDAPAIDAGDLGGVTVHQFGRQLIEVGDENQPVAVGITWK